MASHCLLYTHLIPPCQFQIATKEDLNPIRQDERNGRPRYVHHDYPYKWNYGALPQTWEDPSHEWFAVEGERMDKPGDNDPLDVIDIGGQGHRVGDVIEVGWLIWWCLVFSKSLISFG